MGIRKRQGQLDGLGIDGDDIVNLTVGQAAHVDHHATATDVACMVNHGLSGNQVMGGGEGDLVSRGIDTRERIEQRVALRQQGIGRARARRRQRNGNGGRVRGIGQRRGQLDGPRTNLNDVIDMTVRQTADGSVAAANVVNHRLPVIQVVVAGKDDRVTSDGFVARQSSHGRQIDGHPVLRVEIRERYLAGSGADQGTENADRTADIRQAGHEEDGRRIDAADEINVVVRQPANRRAPRPVNDLGARLIIEERIPGHQGEGVR